MKRVTGKTILELSKGYRQRVGLAQAMVHNPDVLILDEPTSGLDPNQIVEVRSLITRLGEQHTVILSTHYLQEVEASCSRVVIISQGDIVANDTRANLIDRLPAKSIRARIKGPADAIVRQIDELFPGRGAEEIGRDGDYGLFRVQCGESSESTSEEALAELVVKNGWALSELSREKAHLEDVFRDLTLQASQESGDA